MIPRSTPAVACLAFFLSAALASLSTVVNAQSNSTTSAISITGRVLDDSTKTPLMGAQLRLSWALPLATANSGVHPDFLRANSRAASTDARGQYEFRNLPRGRYLLIGWAIGFKADTVQIDLAPPGFDYSFSLAPVAISIVGVEVTSRNPQPFRFPDNRFADSLGIRRSIFNTTRDGYTQLDIREVTAADVREAIPLAEADIFRTLQRTPGVGTRDDYTATLWTRGAPWDQTRVYFDGQPLYNPTHGGWLFSSINPEGIGAAYYMPGVRPAWIGEGAAGVLDLETRRGDGGNNFHLTTDLSVVSARVAAGGILPAFGGPANGAWMLSVRRTYIDWFTSAVKAVGGSETAIPYDFSDVILRLDASLPLGFDVEASGLYERDELRGDFQGVLRGNQASWGNRAGRVTLSRPFNNYEFRLTAGATEFGTRLLELETPDDVPAADNSDDPTLPSLRNGLSNASLTLEMLSRAHVANRPSWTLGAQLTRQDAEYDGPFSLTAEGIPGVDPDEVIRIPFLYRAELKTGAFWGQVLLDVGQRLRLDLGVRAETGRALANGGSWRVAPRIGARVTVDSLTWASLGASRSFQYSQDVGAAAGPLGPQLHLTHVWQLASSGVPVLKSDITTVGVERQLSANVQASANYYRRESTGMTVPDPTPGEIRSDRPLFQIAEHSSRGIELSLRRLSTAWTGSASYTFAHSDITTSAHVFPSPADVRHSFDVTLSRRLSDSFRLSGAASYSSGVPYTRFVAGGGALRLEDPYARRSPAYASADLSLEYGKVNLSGDKGLVAYVQIRNVFNRANRVTYAGTLEECFGEYDGAGMCSGSLRVTDRFDRGIPVIPLVGFRLAF